MQGFPQALSREWLPEWLTTRLLRRMTFRQTVQGGDDVPKTSIPETDRGASERTSPPEILLTGSVRPSVSDPTPIVSLPQSNPPSGQAAPPAEEPIDTVALQAKLFRLLGDAKLAAGVDFDIESVLHKLFVMPADVEQFCRLLAQPYSGGNKKISAVIGLGGYGSVLAYGIARLLPPYPFGENETRPVAFLTLERRDDRSKGGRWYFASPRDAGTLLRNRRVLIVAPMLTRAITADIQICVKLIEDTLGVNATVVGVSTLYQLQCSDRLPVGRSRIFDNRTVLRLDFQILSPKNQ